MQNHSLGLLLGGNAATRIVAALALTLLSGCPDDGSGGTSDAGALNPGLEQPVDGGPGISSEDLEPLAESAFVFFKKKDERQVTLHAYDTATGEDWPISDEVFDYGDDSFALSKDRTFIAFTTYNGISGDELLEMTKTSGSPTRAIWFMTMDGSQRIRAMNPMPGVASTECTVDAQCPGQLVCSSFSGRCEPRAFTHRIGQLAWDKDGDSLLFSHTQLWTQGTQLAGGGRIYAISEGGLTPRALATQTDCLFVTKPTPHPLRNEFIALNSSCLARNQEGVARYALGGGPAEMVASETSSPFSLGVPSTLAWSADGTGYLLSVRSAWDLNGDGVADTEATREGLVYHDLSEDEFVPLVIAESADRYIGDFGFSPNGQVLYYCSAGNNQPSQFHMLNLAESAPTWQTPPIAGLLCTMDW